MAIHETFGPVTVIVRVEVVHIRPSIGDVPICPIPYGQRGRLSIQQHSLLQHARVTIHAHQAPILLVILCQHKMVPSPTSLSVRISARNNVGNYFFDKILLVFLAKQRKKRIALLA
jgi:hypothetical protein